MRELPHLIACPMCDTLHRSPRLDSGQTARCRVCHAELGKYSGLDRRRSIPLVLTCLMLFITANVFPIVSLDMQGTEVPLTLIGAVSHLLQAEMLSVALMVFMPTLLLPGMYLLLLLMVLVVTGIRRIPDRTVNLTVRMMQQLYPWSMVEVFLLGVLVAIIKLSGTATVVLGPALWALCGMVITLTIVLTFNIRRLIRRDHAPAPARRGGLPVPKAGHDHAHLPTAHSYLCSNELGIIACHHCETVWSDVREGRKCGHCGAPLLRRKRGGLAVTWALLIAAIFLYIPANLLPVMSTITMFGQSDDTILSGVIWFWEEGEWALAAIIFIASFLIPLFKLTVMLLLLILTQMRSLWRLRERTHLYEIVEWVGRWSMLDVFVVAVTSSLVQSPGLAVINAGPGIASFGAVVVLTMLATMSYDPRLAWDARFHHDEAPGGAERMNRRAPVAKPGQAA